MARAVSASFAAFVALSAFPAAVFAVDAAWFADPAAAEAREVAWFAFAAAAFAALTDVWIAESICFALSTTFCTAVSRLFPFPSGKADPSSGIPVRNLAYMGFRSERPFLHAFPDVPR